MFSNIINNRLINHKKNIRFHLSRAFLVLKRTKGQGCPIHCKTYKGFEFPCRPGANLIGWQVKSGDRRPVPIRQIYWTWSFCKPIGGEKLEQQGEKNKSDIFANLCWPGHLICESFEVGSSSSSSLEGPVWIVFHAANVVFHSVLHLMLWEKIEIVCLENIWTQALRRREFCWNSVTWQLNIEALFPSETFPTIFEQLTNWTLRWPTRCR